MGKRRVYEVAKELGIDNKDLLKKLQDAGIEVKSHSSAVDEEDVKKALAVSQAPKKPEQKRAPGMIVRKKADIPITHSELKAIDELQQNNQECDVASLDFNSTAKSTDTHDSAYQSHTSADVQEEHVPCSNQEAPVDFGHKNIEFSVEPEVNDKSAFLELNTLDVAQDQANQSFVISHTTAIPSQKEDAHSPRLEINEPDSNLQEVHAESFSNTSSDSAQTNESLAATKVDAISQTPVPAGKDLTNKEAVIMQTGTSVLAKQTELPGAHVAAQKNNTASQTHPELGKANSGSVSHAPANKEQQAAVTVTGNAAKPTVGARVVRMIDKDKLISRIPQRRQPYQGNSGNQNYRPGAGNNAGGYQPRTGPYQPNTGTGPRTYQGPAGQQRPAYGSGGGYRPQPYQQQTVPPHLGTNNANARFPQVRDIRATDKGKDASDSSLDKKKSAKSAAPGAVPGAENRREKLDKRSLLAIHEQRTILPTRLKKKKASKRVAGAFQFAPMKASKRVVHMKEKISVGDLAKAMSVKASEVIQKLFALGVMASINQSIDFDTVTLVAQAFEYTVESQAFDEQKLLKEGDIVNTDTNKKPRPPVVTVMGHVDHGKTSLLDAIRNANVASGEAGGITQHIGAYVVETPKGSITFLDTPGHEAFTAMRARGAQVTDIVILVVAADDGPMPQTIEAIRHAQAAKVPIVVAVNKIDKPGARFEQIQQTLTEFQLVPEEWGGDTIFVKTSAIKKTGVKELLESVLLQAEMLDLKANPDKLARGTVVEAKLDKGVGARITLIVQEGTLKVGDPIVIGDKLGKVRAMFDSKGKQIKEAPPSMALELIGLDGVPNAGEQFYVVDSLDKAKEISEHRQLLARDKEMNAKRSQKLSLEDLYAKMKGSSDEESKQFKVIVKADVQGSVEAIRESLNKLSTSEVTLSVIHSGVGGVSESDIMLASASHAMVITFNVRPDSKAKTLATNEGVEIKTYSIIYNLIDDIKKAMGGLLSPTTQEKVLGRAEIRQTYHAPKVGTIAGCFVTEGKITRASKIRLLRDSIQIYEGKLSSLKRFKDDVREVSQGFECGLVVDGYNDIKVGDAIEAYEIQEFTRTLESSKETPSSGRSTTNNARPTNQGASAHT